MTSSSDRPTISVLRGPAAAVARPARLHADLRTSRYAGTGRLDPRLVDTDLERAVAEAAAVAEDEARTEGWAVGYQAGYDAGRLAAADEAATAAAAVREESRAAATRLESAAQQALSALTAAASALDRRVAPAGNEIGALAARWAVEIAETLVGHHLTVGECTASDALGRVLAQTGQSEPVAVRMHPDDIATLTALGPVPPHVTLTADASVAPGGALAESGDRRVDACIDSALQRLREVLDR